MEILQLDGMQGAPLVTQDNGVQDWGYDGAIKIEASYLFFQNFTGVLKDDGPVSNFSYRKV